MKILVAIDGSECSHKAIEFLMERPAKADDQFLVLSVVEPIPQDFGLGHAPPPTGSIEDKMFEECAEVSGRGAALLRSAFPQNEVDVRVEAGLVADTICHSAQLWNADLIVMGSHGRTGLSHFFLGSVAEEVLKRSHCSVEVIKGKERVKADDAVADVEALSKPVPASDSCPTSI